MTITKEKKHSIINEFKAHEKDTGSPSVQVAILTERINYLINHFKSHPKDFTSRRGLLMLVGQRRKLLNYIKDHQINEYKEIISKLNLRK